MYMYNTVSLYYGDEKLGDVEIYPPKELHLQQKQNEEEETVMKKKKIMEEVSFKKEIRINQFSQPSERCPPLAVLHTVARSGLCFKLETKSKSSSLLAGETQLHHLHASCIGDNKTAVMLRGEEELHLVALYSRSNGNQYPCFWAFNVASGLYDSCLVMLNLRCLGIVFDLDETLVVANTMRSFEDRIEGLQRRLSNEVDPQRIGLMVAELKRYQEDKSILKQYVEADQVLENGKLMKAQCEVVPALSVNHQSIVRPIIRLQEKNIILTRINPSIRDTSVLVRLRPSWEELQSYLTARGRKRFEVYVCTMAERDYALEMWRLLDPDSNLINTNELLDRIVCVKSGSKKSLFHVFQDGSCHPKMALVIDDRLKVWDEKDQPRVHVVPAFAPYHDPQAEAAAIPVLCVARNVACNVRGGFFKDFDDGLLQSITGISYENDIEDIPCAPDVCNYLVSEDDATALNGNRDPLSFDGMADAEVERRLKEAISVPPAVPFAMAANPDPRLGCPLPSAMASSSVLVPMRPTQPTVMPFPVMQYPQPASLIKPAVPCSIPEPSLQSSPVREEGEVPESELDPDTRRRLLILQHGQDSRDPPPADPPFPQRPQVQVSTTPRLQSRSGWFPVEDEMSPAQFHRAVPKEFSMGPEPIHMEKHRQPHPSFLPKVDNSVPSDRTLHEYQRLPKEPLLTEDQPRSRNEISSYRSFYGDEAPLGRFSSRGRDPDFVSEQIVSTTETPAEVLHGIATKCGAKVEYRPALVASNDLQFSVEARIAGERIGEGVGRTRREAMHMAAEGSIQTLANMYMSRINPDFGPANRDTNALANGNRFLGSTFFSGNHLFGGEETVHQLDPARPMETRLEVSKRSTNSISALNELCTMEGLGLVFQPHHPPPIDSAQPPEVHAQVEIDGQVFGKGIGSTWDEARIQAAERALGSLRLMLAQSSHKRQESPRSMHEASSKRQKLDPRVLQRVPSTGRYPNSPPIP